MVNIGIDSAIMEAKKDKIQIFPSKQQHNSYSKIMPKLTKTIMSPLTTMPTKKLMIATNGTSAKLLTPPTTNQVSENRMLLNAVMERNEHKVITLQSTNASKAIEKKTIPSPIDDKRSASQSIEKSCKENISKEKSKETAVYRSEREKILLGDVQSYITCYLCKGYLIKATTIVECLHTYCHSCLMKYLSREKSCPQCEMSISKSKTNIKYALTYAYASMLVLVFSKQIQMSCTFFMIPLNKISMNTLSSLYTYPVAQNTFSLKIFSFLLLALRYDATIQSIVYKLVPGLYEKELLRRRAFYKQRPDEAKNATPEERGDDTEHLIFSPSDLMSLSLDYAEKE
jgi:hypothetical protein